MKSAACELGVCAGSRKSQRSRIARVGRQHGSVRIGRWCLWFWLAAVELAHNIGANRPRSDLRGLGLLAFAVRLLVGRADEAAFDQDVSAFPDAVENGLGQARAKNRDAMPLDFRDPFVFCVFQERCVATE